MCYDGLNNFKGFCGKDCFDKKRDDCFDCGFGSCAECRKPERKPCFCCNVVFNCRPCPPKPRPLPPPKPCCIPFWGCFCVDGFHDKRGIMPE